MTIDKESLVGPLFSSLRFGFENENDAISFFATQKPSDLYRFRKNRRMLSVPVANITPAVLKAVFSDKDDPGYLLLIHEALTDFNDHGEGK